MAARRNWTREELVVAFNLYCKIPFSKINYRLPEIEELARSLGRSPSAVAWKLVNFASLDPELKKRNISGAKNAGKLDEEIFNEFAGDWNALALESEMLMEQLLHKDVSEPVEQVLKIREGKEREATVKVRLNQSFFRTAVLASYENHCCITGLPIPKLLVASHIVPWAADEKNRLNPQNGLCLNNLHDKAFDQGLLTLDENFKIVLSKELTKLQTEESILRHFAPYEGQQITMPRRFLPSQELLEYHRRNIFIA